MIHVWGHRRELKHQPVYKEFQCQSVLYMLVCCVVQWHLEFQSSIGNMQECTCPSHAMVGTLIHHMSTVTLSCAFLLQPSSFTRTLVQSISPVSAAVIIGVEPFWNQMHNEHRTCALQLTWNTATHIIMGHSLVHSCAAGIIWNTCTRVPNQTAR